MRKYFILTGLFKCTAFKVSGWYESYELNFLGFPWMKSTLEYEISTLLTFDYMEQAYLDPEAEFQAAKYYGEWRDSLEKVGIGIQAWLVNVDWNSDPKLQIWSKLEDYPHPSKKPRFRHVDFPECGWRLNALQEIEMRACYAGSEKLGYKPLGFLVSEVKPAVSYIWPSEDRRDPKAMNELEAQLLSQL